MTRGHGQYKVLMASITTIDVVNAFGQV